MSIPEGVAKPLDPSQIAGLVRSKEILESSRKLIPLLVAQELANLDRLVKIAEAEGLREVQALRDFARTGK
jgi:hypothetical protein